MKPTPARPAKNDNRKSKTGLCKCPYCDQPLAPDDFCIPCGVEVTYCRQCGLPLPRDADECPECGCCEKGSRE